MVSGIRGRCRVALFCVVLVAASAGCSGSDDGAGGAVLDGLERVRYTGEPPAAVTVVDAERAGELLAEDERRFAFVDGLGTPLLSDFAVPEHRYGLEEKNADLAVTVGTGAYYGFWTGEFDEGAVTADLADDGYAERQADGGPVWEAPEDELTLRVSDEEIVWGQGGDFDPSVLTEGQRLSEEPRYQALNECLGDVYRADFVEGHSADPTTAYAIGQLAESPEETSEVLCAASDSEATAEQAAELLRQEIEAGGDTYRGGEVTVLDGDVPMVRVTVPDHGSEQRPGRLMTEDVQLVTALFRA